VSKKRGIATRVGNYQRGQAAAARAARERAQAKATPATTPTPADKDAPPVNAKEDPYSRLLRKMREDGTGDSRDEGQQK